MNKLFSIFIFSLFLIPFSYSQTSIFGKWKTIDDETGEAKSIVEIFQKGDKAFGKIIEILDKEKPTPVCDKCDDDDPRKGQKILGMEIIKDLEKDDDEWDDGTILDPENGKVYRCKMWVEDKKLIVRGYIGISLIGRSQTWLSVN
ncbi:DUF2147 domain-containing protein [Fulvivirgaceae bacterium BMA12]|uniref:DUF2147 domain-containing protein n=1 Tax=Agaribacillus aureus TaxID=3051825 RepID=A0ABT8L294_9BACT|nr:DUF2147 domain-containing protein [Fulvivirgaceae bacterium BMA12]